MKLLLTLLILFASQLPNAAHAKDVVCEDEACFPKSVEVAEKRLAVKGIALFEYFRFDVYTAALYIDPSVSNIKGALSDTPKFLVLSYHRGLTKENIVENSDYVLGKNPNVDLASLQPKLKKWYDAFTEVKAGDRFAMSYQPGEGTTLIFNDKKIVTVEGDDFQRAYFGIWLSEHSVGSDFTAELIGK